ncbi:DUF502 domain-containing protein [Umboniibacter marinipuniceus]|uniref:Putative membrane protein n=1 Tax=Umboniibacter marinipuniceus TaxID=569599 RepID=A0A3M0A1F2_9GAMM|nr:DUF502 domain-containing protein [Umboniibacter marinipuniceus]RMA78783.1 putative membrane protein [Umboniibacter marinipuniceus]
MSAIRNFIKNAIIGGVVVILPIMILAFLFRWLFGVISELISPITSILLDHFDLPELVGDILALSLIISLCFLLGTIVATSVGSWIHERFDRYASRLAPGYNLIKEIVGQFFGDKSNSPFANGEVAVVNLYGINCPARVTALVTSRHPNGDFTVFVPTGPNPTSGMMYHLPPEAVTLYPDIGVEDMMRTVIACGAGTGALLSRHQGERQTNREQRPPSA